MELKKDLAGNTLKALETYEAMFPLSQLLSPCLDWSFAQARPQGSWILTGLDSGSQRQAGKSWSAKFGLTCDLDQSQGSEGSVEKRLLRIRA